MSIERKRIESNIGVNKVIISAPSELINNLGLEEAIKRALKERKNSVIDFYLGNPYLKNLKEYPEFKKEVSLLEGYKLILLANGEQSFSIVVDNNGNVKAFHSSANNGLLHRKEFGRDNKKNPYFEGINYSSKYSQKIFENLIINGRAKALETGKVEEVLKFFLPDGILKGTKDAGYLFGKDIGKYFEDFLALNPKGEFIGRPAIYVIGSDLVIVTGYYVFELDSDKGRVKKPAKYLFVIKRVKGGKDVGKWGIQLLHSSFATEEEKRMLEEDGLLSVKYKK